MLLHRAAHTVQEQVTNLCYAPTDDDHRWIKEIERSAEAAAEPTSCRLDSCDSILITLLCRPGDVLPRRNFPFLWHAGIVIGDERWTADIAFQAAVQPACAFAAIPLNHYMAHHDSRSARTMMHLTVNDESATDTSANGHA